MDYFSAMLRVYVSIVPNLLEEKIMSDPKYDAGVIQALLERLNSQRLPMLLEMKERVDKGEKLTDYDMSKLAEIFAHIGEIEPLLDRHQDYRPLVAKVANLYKEVLARAVDNEKSAAGST
jgi:hypothetical protein